MPRFRRNTPANPTVGDQINQTLTFWGMVGVVMTALKLKDRWDGYRQSDEEGAVRLPSSPDTEPRDLPAGDDDISMVDTQIPRPKRVRRKGCCMCCGIDCTIFWKAIGIVLLLFTIWNGIKAVKWFLTPTPTGLEGMPEFSTSLGCSSAPYIYEGAQTTYTIPVTGKRSMHDLNIQGGALGTVTITDAAAGATDITLELTLRTDTESLLQDVSVSLPRSDHKKSWTEVTLTTPSPIAPGACMRFDATVRVPAALRSLTLTTDAVTQVRLDPAAAVSLDWLSVALRALDARSMLELSEGVRARNVDVHASRGWVVGATALVNSTAIATAGDAVANVHVRPTPPADPLDPVPAYLTTSHATGRADFFYESNGAYAHRPIVSSHTSRRGGDLYLTYKQAEFVGTVDLEARSHTAYGLQGSIGSAPGQVEKGLPWVGDADGGDVLVVKNPRGWVGLYF